MLLFYKLRLNFIDIALPYVLCLNFLMHAEF